MKIFKKNILERNHISIKNFSYKKGKMNLSFSIDIGNKKDIDDFLELLKVAQEELSEEIN